MINIPPLIDNTNAPTYHIPDVYLLVRNIVSKITTTQAHHFSDNYRAKTLLLLLNPLATLQYRCQGAQFLKRGSIYTSKHHFSETFKKSPLALKVRVISILITKMLTTAVKSQLKIDLTVAFKLELLHYTLGKTNQKMRCLVLKLYHVA